MSVSLRKRRLSDGRVSLYLDIYQNGRRTTEWLKLYLTEDREQNEKLLAIARKVRAERELSLASFAYDFSPSKKHQNFVEYAQSVIAQKREGNKVIFHKFLKHFISYAGTRTTFADIDKTFCQKFVSYLESQPRVGPGTVYLYVTKLRTILGHAVNSDVIKRDPSKGIQTPTSKRIPQFLSLHDLRILAKVEPTNQEVGYAFLFSCATGLRLSDVTALTPAHIKDGAIVLIQQKTGEPVVIPLGHSALHVLSKLPPERMNRHGKLFDLPDYRTINRTLKRWATGAKLDIGSKLTFHVARHTFCTLSLQSGIDLLVVSKLLGHTKLATTTRYASIVNSHKEKAIGLLPDFIK